MLILAVDEAVDVFLDPFVPVPAGGAELDNGFRLGTAGPVKGAANPIPLTGVGTDNCNEVFNPERICESGSFE